MKKIKLFFDTTLLLNHAGGMTVYAKQLLNFLSRREDIELHSGFKSISLKSHLQLKNTLDELYPGKIKYHPRFFPGRIECNNYLMKKIFTFNAAKYDLMHFPMHIAPAYVQPRDMSNAVLTVHDMTTFYPEFSINNPEFRKLLYEKLPVQAEHAKAIVTISEFAKKEIIKFLNIPEKKIHIIPNGTQWSESSNAPSDILTNISLEPKSYFLAVSFLAPHKNYPALCSAFKKYRSSKEYAGEKLVIVGKRRIGDEDIYNTIKNTQDVIYLEFIADNDLKTLYCNSKGFFFISKMEGFGIPLLEAMNCKIPACYGLGSSMDEIGRDAAVGVIPDDIDTIANTFAVFSAGGEELQKKIDRAYEISLEYSWENAGTELAELYYKLLK